MRSRQRQNARLLFITALLPLVACILPAFGLIAIVPLVLRGLGGIA